MGAQDDIEGTRPSRARGAEHPQARPSIFARARVVAAAGHHAQERHGRDGRADDGAYLDAHLQLGSGATDGLFGAAFQHVRGRWALNGNVLGALRGQGEAGAHDYDYGDSLNYDLTVRYRVSPATLGGGPRRWFLSCGLGGEVRGKEIEAGSRIDDSGGHVLFVQPGLQLGVGARWTFEVGAQVPVHHDLAGTQLGEDLKVFGALNVLL